MRSQVEIWYSGLDFSLPAPHKTLEGKHLAESRQTCTTPSSGPAGDWRWCWGSGPTTPHLNERKNPGRNKKLKNANQQENWDPFRPIVHGYKMQMTSWEERGPFQSHRSSGCAPLGSSALRRSWCWRGASHGTCSTAQPCTSWPEMIANRNRINFVDEYLEKYS